MEPHSGPNYETSKQRKDGTWYAEASWPNAPTEDIGHFKSASDVREIGSLTRRTNISSKGLGYSPDSRGLRGTIILHVERGAPAIVWRVLATEPALVGVA